MTKMEDIKYSGNPFRSRNRIEEAMGHLPQLRKENDQIPNPKEPKEPETPLGLGHWKLRFKRTLLWIFAVCILGAFVSGSLLIYRQYESAKAETPEATLAEVSKLIDLPDEKPTIATISDLAPLKSEPFFQNAMVGDKVLIYSAAKKAILYRPSTKKIIIVAPIR